MSIVGDAGLWRGKRVCSDTGRVYSMQWTLAMMTTVGYPTAFGASIASFANQEEGDAIATAKDGGVVRVLHGEYDAARSRLELCEMDTWQAVGSGATPVAAESSSTASTESGTASNEDENNGITTTPLTRILYTCKITIDPDGTKQAIGQWREVMKAKDDQKDVLVSSGGFACVREADHQRHWTNMWIGEAVPDESLEAFCLPTNPIYWVLTFMPSTWHDASTLHSSSPGVTEVNRDRKAQQRHESITVVGAGYLNDSADIPNQPVLTYSLRGVMNTCNVGDESPLSLTKTYERAEETKDYRLEYQGVVVGEEEEGNGSGTNITDVWQLMGFPCPDGRDSKTNGDDGADFAWTPSKVVLRGKWSNPAGGSFGSFLCRPNVLGDGSNQICLCDICSKPIAPGIPRWACHQCPTPFHCCQRCFTDAESKAQSELAQTCSKSVAMQMVHPVESHKLEKDIVYSARVAKGDCSTEVILSAFKEFPERPLVGKRVHNDSDSASNCDGTFEWWSYGRLEEMTARLWTLYSTANVKPGQRIVFVGDISITYTCSIFAAVLHGCVCVPLDGAADVSSLRSIVVRSDPVMVVVDQKYHRKLESVLSESDGGGAVAPILKLVLTITETQFGRPPMLTATHHSTSTARATDMTHSSEVDSQLRLPHRCMHALDVDTPNVTTRLSETPKSRFFRAPPEHVSAVLFTSGTTGSPKGAVFNEDLLLPTESLVAIAPFVRMDFQTFDPSYVLSMLSTIMLGGCRGISSPEFVMEDVTSVRPTHIGATPIFWKALYDDFHTTRLGMMAERKDRSEDAHEQVAEEVAAAIRARLGNRLSVATSGGAAVSEDVLRFVREKLKVDLISLYGSRETGGIARDGVVYKQVQVRVLKRDGDDEDREDLVVSGEVDRKHRGEILVHSPRLIEGYWSDSELNSRAFVTVQGKRFYRTGDVGDVWLDAQGNTHVNVIDRSSHAIKTSMGEWVAPTEIESVIEELPGVKFAFVDGKAEESRLVCVVVMSEESGGVSGGDDATKSSVRERNAEEVCPLIRFWCAHRQMRPAMIPQAVHVETELTWTSQNGLLTSTMKKVRSKLKLRYRQAIDEMFDKLKADELNQRCHVGDARGDKELDPLIRSVLPPSLSSPGYQHTPLSQLAVDSITLSRIRQVLKSNFKLDVPISALVQYTPAHISSVVSIITNGGEALDGTASTLRASLSSVVSTASSFRNERNRSMDEWRKEWTLNDEVSTLCQDLLAKIRQQQGRQNVKVSSSNHPMHEVLKKGKVVFVTGSTGFIGPVLVATIVNNLVEEEERMVRRGETRGKTQSTLVACVVRGKSEEEAAKRFWKGIEETKLTSRAAGFGCGLSVMHRRVKVMKGDVSRPDLGLSEQNMEWLMSTGIASIVHNASVVNMVLPFETLRGSNVHGLVEVVRLAIRAKLRETESVDNNKTRSESETPRTTPCPRIVFVSSVAALGAGAGSDGAGREEWQNLNAAELNIKGGYGQSKAVSEKLLQHCVDVCRVRDTDDWGDSEELVSLLDVAVVRLGVISGHRRTGYCNPADFGNILLRSIVMDKLCPSRVHLNLKWLPCDVASEAMSLIALCRPSKPQAPEQASEKRKAKKRVSFGDTVPQGVGDSPSWSGPKQIFHIVGDGPDLRHVVKTLIDRGTAIRLVEDEDEWRIRMENLPPTHSLFPIKDTLAKVNFRAPDGGNVNVSETCEALRSTALSLARNGGEDDGDVRNGGEDDGDAGAVGDVPDWLEDSGPSACFTSVTEPQINSHLQFLEEIGYFL